MLGGIKQEKTSVPAKTAAVGAKSLHDLHEIKRTETPIAKILQDENEKKG